MNQEKAPIASESVLQLCNTVYIDRVANGSKLGQSSGAMRIRYCSKLLRLLTPSLLGLRSRVAALFELVEDTSYGPTQCNQGVLA